MTKQASLPLENVRVLEFSHMVMGPTCGMILADLGADVVKVEPPGGDRTRTLTGLGVGFFRTFNRNKKSIVVDIASTEGQQAIKDLVPHFDVVLENFRPGLMAEFGLDYNTLSEINSGLIYASHKGFLPGPYEDRLALDEVVQLMGGLAYMTGPEGKPLRAGSSVNDIMGGMFGVIGILAALRQRDANGRGQEVQSALFENCVFLSAQHMQQYAITKEPPKPLPQRTSAWGIYDLFDLADGQQIFIAAVSDKQFDALCKVLGLYNLVDDPALSSNTSRVHARSTLVPALAQAVSSWALGDITRQLEASKIPYATVKRPDELFDDTHLRLSGGLAEIRCEDGSTTEVPLLPLMMSGNRLNVRMSLPSVGEHTDEVFRQCRVKR